MSAQVERIQIITEMQASEALTEIQRLTLANKNLNAQLEQTVGRSRQASTARRELRDQIRQNTLALNEHYRSLGNDGLNINQLNTKLKNLQKQYRELIPASANYTAEERRLRQEIVSTTSALESRNSRLRQTESIFTMLRTQGPAAIIGGIGGGIAAMLMTLVSSISAIVPNAVEKFAKITDKLAQMRKATGLTEQGVESLNSKIAKIDTRTAVSDLQDIVVIAGQMGIANEQVKNFTNSTDKLTVALSDEFKGGAEEVTKVFGSLRNVLVDIKTDNVGDDILKIGNAVNVLGANGLATGPVVADITNRIGSAGQVYGVTAGQTLGLAAAYQEMTISAERGSTATIKILARMSSAPEEFAKIAGMSTKKFKELVNSNIMQAFLLVSEGFAKSKGAATEFAKKLEDAEISSASITEVLSKVGQNTKMVQEKMDLATDSLTNTNSIMDEFNLKNENFAADLEKAGKNLGRLTSSFSKFASAIVAPFISLFASLGKETESATDRFNQNRIATDQLIGKTESLSKKYTELQPKITSNKTAQAELNQVIKEIATLVPGAGTSFDAYGNALTVNMGIVNQFIDKQKILQKQMKFDALNELSEANNKLGGERAQLVKLLASGNYAKDWVGMNLVNLPADKAAANYAKITTRIKELTNEINYNWKLKRDFDKDISVNPVKPSKPATTDSLSDEEIKKQQQLAQKRIENHAKVIAETNRMDIEQLEDVFQKKKASIEEEMRLYVEEKAKQLQANELSQEDYDKAISAKAKQTSNELTTLEKERAKKEEEQSIKLAKLIQETKLKLAELGGDEELIISQKIALNIVEEQLALFQAGEEQHTYIKRNYAAERAKLEIEATKKAEDTKFKLLKDRMDASIKYQQEKAIDDKFRELETTRNTEDAKMAFKRRATEALSDLTFSFISSNTENEVSQENDKYQRLLKLNDDRLAQGLISEQEHANRKIQIEEQHDAKVRDLKRKQAIFDKARALMDIAINTATGVIKAASGIVTSGMIPWIIATGAVEAAAVAATPIPQFMDGGFTDNAQRAFAMFNKPTSQSKLAWVNEAGPEFILNNGAVRSSMFPVIYPILEAMNRGQDPSNEKVGTMTDVKNTTGSMVSVPVTLLEKLTGLFDKLNTHLDNPKSPVLVIGYKTAEEIVDAANEVKSIKSNVLTQ